MGGLNLLDDVGSMDLAKMFLDFFARGKFQSLGNVEANVLGFPALLVDPFLNDGFVFDDFDARFEGVEWHAGETLGMQLAKLVLVIVVIGRAQNDAAHSTLGDKRVGALGRIGLCLLSLVERCEVPVEQVADGFFFGEPDGFVQRALK